MRGILLVMMLLTACSCQRSSPGEGAAAGDDKDNLVFRKRDDGTISSVNQVDEEGKVHGIRATYYQDGKTVYSKQSFEHGIKQGPAAFFYTNGQLFKQTNFEDGKRQGMTRIYFRDGSLAAEFESDQGLVLPGLKEYDRSGRLIMDYPGVEFREIDHLASLNRVDLEISCTKRHSGVKFYKLNYENGDTSRVYLITENDQALMQYYVKPGEELHEQIDILAEIPTKLGNILVKKYSYPLEVVR
jgi:antitoxin component YwqK of YwqJK toxin-antitoxin module